MLVLGTANGQSENNGQICQYFGFRFHGGFCWWKIAEVVVELMEWGGYCH